MPQTRPEPEGKSTSASPLGAGLTMIAAVALFTLGGQWLDERLGWSSPLFLLVGFGLGAFGGFLHLVNAVAPELLPFRSKPGFAARSGAAKPRQEPADPGPTDESDSD